MWLKKDMLKKLVKDCCTKTVFPFNNVLYKQKDGSSLGPILTNVIITELERKILQPLIQ